MTRKPEHDPGLRSLGRLAGSTGILVVSLVVASRVQRGGFVGPVPLTAVWIFMIAAWGVSMLAVARHYR
jgi:hypothetical protein